MLSILCGPAKQPEANKHKKNKEIHKNSNQKCMWNFGSLDNAGNLNTTVTNFSGFGWMTNLMHNYVHNYNPVHVSSNSVLIIRRSYCINTASGIIFSVSDRPVCRLRTVTYREYDTRCCINTIWRPDDEHRVARTMYRIIIINVSYNVIVHQVGHLPTVIPGCTVSKT